MAVTAHPGLVIIGKALHPVCIGAQFRHVCRHPWRLVQPGIAFPPGQIEDHERGPGPVDQLGFHLFQPDLGGLGLQNLVGHPGAQ